MGNKVLGFGILLGTQAVGQTLTNWLRLPLPGTLTGMLLLAVLLITGVLSPERVEYAINHFLDHMPLFFIPLAVGIVGAWDLIRGQLPVLSLVVVLSTFIVLTVTGWTTQLLINRLERHPHKEGGETRCG